MAAHHQDHAFPAARQCPQGEGTFFFFLVHKKRRFIGANQGEDPFSHGKGRGPVKHHGALEPGVWNKGIQGKHKRGFPKRGIIAIFLIHHPVVPDADGGPQPVKEKIE